MAVPVETGRAVIGYEATKTGNHHTIVAVQQV